MSIQYLTLEQTEHPLRAEISSDEMVIIIQGIINDENWMSLDEIEAAQDFLFDRLIVETQTHLGSLAVN